MATATLERILFERAPAAIGARFQGVALAREATPDVMNTPEFHVRVQWKPGTVAVWEERITQHCAVDSFIGERKLRRLTIKGDKPQAGV